MNQLESKTLLNTIVLEIGVNLKGKCTERSSRLVLGNMADRLCDDNDDKKKLINKRNPAGFAIPFLDQVSPVIEKLTCDASDCAGNSNALNCHCRTLES